MRGRAIRYSAEELAWLEAHRTAPIADYAAGFAARFARTIDPKNLHALRKRKGWKTGRTGRFPPGHPPANKGQRCPEGQGGRHPNARATQFKPGHRGGRAADNYKPIGAERISREGYLERKINDDMPFNRRWRAVHLIRWEAVNGPIPKGHVLKSLDGDPANTDPANYALIPRGALAILNRAHNGLTYDDAPAELKPAILAIARVKHAASSKARAARGAAADDAQAGARP